MLGGVGLGLTGKLGRCMSRCMVGGDVDDVLGVFKCSDVSALNSHCVGDKVYIAIFFTAPHQNNKLKSLLERKYFKFKCCPHF